MTWLQILQLILTLAAQVANQLHPPAKPGLSAPEGAASKKAEFKQIGDKLQTAVDAIRQLEKKEM